MKKVMLALLIAVPIVTAVGCSDSSRSAYTKQQSQVNNEAGHHRTYIPHRYVERNNYEQAQKLYDDPSTIIFCSTTWGNPSTPIVTVPIAGKLTSSTTSYFAPERVINNDDSGSGVATPARSVDGLFHPNPPSYRYGFTPGGQYVDFYNMDTFCTTALTKFQRKETRVTVSLDPGALETQRKAEAALRRGDKKGAQRILEAGIQ